MNKKNKNRDKILKIMRNCMDFLEKKYNTSSVPFNEENFLQIFSAPFYENKKPDDIARDIKTKLLNRSRPFDKGSPKNDEMLKEIIQFVKEAIH